MIWRNISALAALASCTLLLGCNTSSTAVSENSQIRGARSSVLSVYDLSSSIAYNNRPTASLGIFSSLYIAQGVIVPVRASITGFEAITSIISGQEIAESDENFALLREVGAVLQVDVIDLLNRSENRALSLNTYIQSLRNAGVLAERKIVELEEQEERQSDRARETKNAFRDLERSANNAMRDMRYEEAASLQEELSTAHTLQLESESQLERTRDLLKRFEDLYEILGTRLQAISQNREILVAGLKVIEVPGIRDLMILEEGESWNSRNRGGLFEGL